MKRGLLSGIISVLFLSHSGGFAWSGAGHMVIAGEAWREFSVPTKALATKVLQAHPEFEKWQAAFSNDSPGVDFGGYILMRASTWPDEIRRRGNKHDHPLWHYIDYPLRAPAFANDVAPSPTDNVLFGIQQCEKVISDPNASAEARAVHLSWLVHLVGDIHQPLHCASLFNATYPAGDKGGNSFYVSPASRGIKLHSFWDGLLGTSGKPRSHLNYAVGLQTGHPRKSLAELNKHPSPELWSLEGRNIAVEEAYLRGRLQGSTSAETAPPLPDGYAKAAKAVAEKQAALAGYRLADEIAKWLR